MSCGHQKHVLLRMPQISYQSLTVSEKPDSPGQSAYLQGLKTGDQSQRGFIPSAVRVDPSAPRWWQL
jgi:hypothetical protein